MTRGDSPTPLMLFVPGLRPKPEAGRHRKLLFRCLLEGLRRRDPDTAADIERHAEAFDLVSWTYDFYGEHRDPDLDCRSIEDLLQQSEATGRDIAEASSFRRRFLRWLYRLGDLLPFLIPHLASERMELHLSDIRRYVGDVNGVATRMRNMLKLPLIAAHEKERPIMLIGHSMGSVLAWDALWELSHERDEGVFVDLLLTMGSPLGQDYVQKRLKGSDATGIERYPGNVRRWINLTAVGDLTAIDPDLADDFAGMRASGAVESIEDVDIFNWYRTGGELNVHAEYGYLANGETARIVSDWWRAQRAGE